MSLTRLKLVRQPVWALAFASIAAATIRCSDSTGPRPLDNSIGVIVSAPVSPTFGAPAAARRASAAAARGLQVVYVSLPPSSVPTGVSATITDRATGHIVRAAVVNGGFDPVPIVASVGDTLTIEIVGSGPPVQAMLTVAAARPLKIVRTSPPSGGRDVPLNATIVVVFSEPIDSATLAPGILLRRGSVTVSGSAGFADTVQLKAAFRPTDQLVPNTTYQLVVTQAIRDFNGIALDSAAVVTFTTGTASTGPAAVSLVVSGLLPAVPVLSPRAFVVTALDSSGQTATGYTGTVHFTSSDASASLPQDYTFVAGDAGVRTFAVQFNTVGDQTITATDLTTSITGSEAVWAIAWVPIQPMSATIILGDTTRLVRTFRDSAGNVVPGLAAWSTSAPNIASVSSTGLVTGTGLGHTFVWAFSGRDSAAANVWVQPPGPAASPSGRIAFVNRGQLYVVNVDGSGLIPLTKDSASYSRPAWSPDAARIAAVRNGQGVVVMKVDGSGAVLVAPGGVSPAWSVDGARVRYAKVLPDSLVEIDEVTPDGSQTTALCAGDFGGAYYHGDHMDWSPNRTTAAFEGGGLVGGMHVFLNDDHCTGVRGLNTGDVAGSPAWSPDGQRIAFASSGTVSDGTTNWINYGILANSPAGSGSPAFIFHDDIGRMSVPLFGSRFSWSPDGKYLAFARDEDAEVEGLQQHPLEIWITPGDGTGVPRRIGATGVQGSDPAWAPR